MSEDIDFSKLFGGENSDAIGNAVNTLLSRPDLVMNIAKELGLSGEAAPKEKNESPPKIEKEEKKPNDRDKLLLALRPYLNTERQSAIDLMLNLTSVGKLLGNVDPRIISAVIGGMKGAGNV